MSMYQFYPNFYPLRFKTEALKNTYQQLFFEPLSKSLQKQIQDQYIQFQLDLDKIHLAKRSNIKQGPRRPLVEQWFHGREQIECHYCGDQIEMDQCTFDHVLAQAMGGDDTLSNMVLCCQPCNVRKADLDYHDYLLTLQEYRTPIPANVRNDKSLQQQIEKAMWALEPSIMQKLDQTFPRWLEIKVEHPLYGKISPAVLAFISTFTYLKEESDPYRNKERLTILARIWKKQLREPEDFIFLDIKEKDWVRTLFYEFDSQFNPNLPEHKDFRNDYRKIKHLVPTFTERTYSKHLVGQMQELSRCKSQEEKWNQLRYEYIQRMMNFMAQKLDKHSEQTETKVISLQHLAVMGNLFRKMFKDKNKAEIDHFFETHSFEHAPKILSRLAQIHEWQTFHLLTQSLLGEKHAHLNEDRKLNVWQHFKVNEKPDYRGMTTPMVWFMAMLFKMCPEQIKDIQDAFLLLPSPKHLEHKRQKNVLTSKEEEILHACLKEHVASRKLEAFWEKTPQALTTTAPNKTWQPNKSAHPV